MPSVIRPPFDSGCAKCLDAMTDMLYVLKMGRRDNARVMLRNHMDHMRRKHGATGTEADL